jgi:hypothetical protein
MRCAQPGVVCLLALAFVAGTCSLLRQGDCLPDLGRAGPGPHPLTPAEEQQEARLQAELQRVQKRMFAKRAVVLAFLAGRMTLREAALHFHELDAGTPPRYLVGWRRTCPRECASEEDRYCWTVVRYVGCEARRDPRQAPAAHQRVRAELPEHLRRLLPPAPRFPKHQ